MKVNMGHYLREALFSKALQSMIITQQPAIDQNGKFKGLFVSLVNAHLPFPPNFNLLQPLF